MYLLNTQAKVRRFTDDYREDINELKKARISCRFSVVATFSSRTQFYCFLVLEYYVNGSVCLQQVSELILEKDKGWDTGEERVLAFHLLEFTEVRPYRN